MTLSTGRSEVFDERDVSVVEMDLHPWNRRFSCSPHAPLDRLPIFARSSRTGLEIISKWRCFRPTSGSDRSTQANHLPFLVPSHVNPSPRVALDPAQCGYAPCHAQIWPKRACTYVASWICKCQVCSSLRTLLSRLPPESVCVCRRAEMPSICAGWRVEES